MLLNDYRVLLCIWLPELVHLSFLNPMPHFKL